jgi:hypothetical protein
LLLLLDPSLELALAAAMAAASHHTSLPTEKDLAATIPQLRSRICVSETPPCKSCSVLTPVAGSKSIKLDLAFALQAFESALATADSREAVQLGTEAAAFLDRNNRNSLEPTHKITFKKGDGTGKTATAYGLTSLIGHASRCRTVHSGNSAYNQCQRGKGNFSDCVTATGQNGDLFSGACTNCAFPNRYKDCSFFNGSSIGPSRAVATAPTANQVATRAITRPRAATQPSRHPQVVVETRRPPPSTVAGSSRSATPVSLARSSRNATPDSIADDLYNVSISPVGRGHTRGQSAPVNSSPPVGSPDPVASFERRVPATPVPTLREAAEGTYQLQQAYILAHIEWIPSGRTEATAWRDGSLDLIFEHFVNPSDSELTRATIEDAIDFDLTSSYVDFQDGDTWVIASATARALVGVGRITISALRLLHRRYRDTDRIRRQARYSSEGPQ